MLPRRLPDLSSVDDATARRLLRAYSGLVKRVVALYRLDADEGLAVGTDAVLEAYLTFRVELEVKESTWVRRVVHWRLAEAHADMPWDRELPSLDTDPQVINGAGPDEIYANASAIAAIARLPIRQQMIVDGCMRDETYAEIASSIGITRSTAQRQGAQALKRLRVLLDEGE